MTPYRLRLSFVLFLLLHVFFPLAVQLRCVAAAPVAIEFLYPNFTGSSVNYIEKDGRFLTSASSAFSAIFSSDAPQSPFVVSILHIPTSTVIWSANPAAPAPYTAVLSLSTAGLSINLSNGSLLWSTPTLSGHVAALQLLDSGNLLLLDSANSSLWQSFEHPTDTLLSSQRLPAGASLSTPAGDYRLLVTAHDLVLIWTNGSQQYWGLSEDPRSVKDSDDPVAYMTTNNSGLFLFSAAGKAVYVVDFPPTKLRFVRLKQGGRLHVTGYSGSGSVFTHDFSAPTGACDLPLSCNELEVCTMQSNGAICNCPLSFTESRTGGCSPADSSTILYPPNCDGASVANKKLPPSYVSLGNQIEYFANKFAIPDSSTGNFSSCRGLCTGNCSCLGFFYRNSSSSCFLIKNQLGSLLSTSNLGVFNSGEGFIKVLAFKQPPQDSGKNFKLIPILTPSIAGILLILLFFAGICWLRHRQFSGKNKLAPLRVTCHGRNQPCSLSAGDHGSAGDISSSGNNENSGEISIQGLPHRFTYSELVTATNNFSTKIGSGGFGEVFYGELSDRTAVAVKRINAGVDSIQGKKEFCTEIAIIGSIHHVNLVRLRGFCAEGRRRRRLLVYEYMNRGSLDSSLFRSSGPVLEWQERMDIAIGAARGLAYLHSGCDRKIVHCDVKPENILLHDHGGIKISDFGLARLIAPERSGLFFTTMRGTRGYLAPEWLANSAISERADVYSYGMVLLEIISGRKNSSEEGGGSEEWWSSGSSRGRGAAEYFPSTALENHEKGRYLALADPRLEGRVREEEVGRAVRVALCCLHEEPALRPPMVAVAAMLDGTMEPTQPLLEALTFFRLYGKGFVNSGITSGSDNRVAADTVSLSDGLISGRRIPRLGGGRGFNS